LPDFPKPPIFLRHRSFNHSTTGASSYTQLIIKGFVLVIAIIISIDRKKIGIIK
jgi:hypothetical protein